MEFVIFIQHLIKLLPVNVGQILVVKIAHCANDRVGGRGAQTAKGAGGKNPGQVFQSDQVRARALAPGYPGQDP